MKHYIQQYVCNVFISCIQYFIDMSKKKTINYYIKIRKPF